MTTMVQNLS